MLLWLAQFFQQDVGPLRVFSFISFRAVFATLTALTIGLLAVPAVIRLLTRLKVGQAVRKGRHADDGRPSDPDRHYGFDSAMV